MTRFVDARRLSLSMVTTLFVAALSCSGKDDKPAPNPQGGAAGDSGSVDGTGGTSTGGKSTSGGASTGTAGTLSRAGAGGAAMIAGSPNAAGSGPIPQVTQGAVYCGTELCACNNGRDDDGDGQIDGFDVECIGAYDNDEDSFATGIPGDNSDPKWQDCFYDGNSGAGDDDCRYSTDCLTGDLEPTDPDCQVTQACIDFCTARTPNGCDCFGCCSVTDAEGVQRFVYITGECTEEALADPTVCTTCTQSTECGNECGECELCPGMTPDDLPDSCAGAGGGPGFTCDDGSPTCTPEIPCDEGRYCMNGCCYFLAL